jgi:hypothetical protein
MPPERAQREQQAEWETALMGSGLPVAGLDADRPKARFVIAAPLASGTPGEAELADIWLVERLPRWRVREALAGRLPEGNALVDLYDVWLGEPPLPGRVAASVYLATVPTADPGRIAAAADALMAAGALPRVRRKGEGTVSYDLRPFLAALEVAAGDEGGAVIRMTLRHDPARGIGRPDETLAALGEALEGPALEAATLARERLVLAELPAPAPTAVRGPRRPPSAGSASAPPRPAAGRPATGPPAGGARRAGR